MLVMVMTVLQLPFQMDLLSFKIPRIIQTLPVLAKGFGLIFSIAAGMEHIFIAPLISL